MKYIILIGILFCGCSPQKRIARLLEKYPLPETYDTFTYDPIVIWRDTIVFRDILGDTVRDSIFIPVDVDLPYMELKRTSTLAEATAWISDNKLGLELIQFDSIYQFLLDSVIRESQDTIKIIHTEYVPDPIKPNPFWKHGFFILAGLIVLGMVLWLVIRK